MFKINLERLIESNLSNPSVLEKEINIMKKWSDREAYEACEIKGSSLSRILESAKPHVRESVNWILNEEFNLFKKFEIKQPYDGYLIETLVQEILSLKNIVAKFENTEKEAHFLLNLMIEYSS